MQLKNIIPFAALLLLAACNDNKDKNNSKPRN